MKLTTSSAVPVYTIAGEGTSRPLPEWLARKRKRSLKKDAEHANRVELLQDFEFEEASQCVRVSEDGEWVVSTGTYKPQMHVHYLPHLSLSYARHTNALNQTFLLLSDDYGKSLHLQTDRSLEFHTPSGLHYTTRIPRYGRDLKYNTRTAEALVPSVGVNAEGYGEVFRLNLEVGRFMKGFEVEVGGDDLLSLGGGALQGGIGAGSVNCAAVAEDSHGLMAFGTSLGTVEFWDARSKNRVSVLGPPTSMSILDTGQEDLRPEITALEFHSSGLNLVTGSSNGLIHTYDLRSPVPLLRKDQGYDSPIQTLKYLTAHSPSSTIAPDKLLTSDRKSIKIFDSISGDLWTSIEPAVDLNHVAWVPDSGMLLTANEGRQQHSFFIPQLGPAPKWCSFLDNLVEEMADESSADPNAWSSSTSNRNPNSGVGEIYDNFKFLSRPELRALNLDHLIDGGGSTTTSGTNVLRPYMHGYFVPQGLYEQARLLANPNLALEQRQKSIQEKIERERESRIRGDKSQKINVRVNKKLAEKLRGREEANERRKAGRMLRKQDAAEEEGGDEVEVEMKGAEEKKTKRKDLMDDERFRGLFEDEDFEIDELSREYQLHNPSSAAAVAERGVVSKRGLTAAEQEDIDEAGRGSSDDDGNDENDEEAEPDTGIFRQRQRRDRTENDNNANDTKGRIGSSSYKKSGHRPQNLRQQQQQKAGPRMQVTSSIQPRQKPDRARQAKSFGDLASSLPARGGGRGDSGGVGSVGGRGSAVVGEKEISFLPADKKGKGFKGAFGGEKGDGGGGGGESGRDVRRGKEYGKGRGKERRSASGNVFRRM